MVGRASPKERPAVPLVVPCLVRLSAKSGRLPRLRLGGCLAAEERRRRWPAEAWKDDWEASVTYRAGEAARNVRNAAARGWRRQVGKADNAAGMGSVGVSISQAWRCRSRVRNRQPGNEAMRTAGGDIASSIGNTRPSHSRRKGGLWAAVQRQWATKGSRQLSLLQQARPK
jgi:hypothetical protein